MAARIISIFIFSFISSRVVPGWASASRSNPSELAIICFRDPIKCWWFLIRQMFESVGNLTPIRVARNRANCRTLLHNINLLLIEIQLSNRNLNSMIQWFNDSMIQWSSSNPAASQSGPLMAIESMSRKLAIGANRRWVWMTNRFVNSNENNGEVSNYTSVIFHPETET